MLKVLIAGMLVFGLAAGVMAGVADSPHNLNNLPGYSVTNAEICLPCHTPHNANNTVSYLWNHDLPADSAFTKWEGSTLGNSLLCLGCHDGATGVDSYGGGTGTEPTIDDDADLGTILTDDHPVGVEYHGGGRWGPEGQTSWGATAVVAYGDPIDPLDPDGPKEVIASVPLFGTDKTVECATCHSPHSTSNDNFLRVDNEGSALCRLCHVRW